MTWQKFRTGQTIGRRAGWGATTAMATLMLAVSPPALAQAPVAQPADMQDGDDSEHVLIVVTGTATPVEYEKIGNTITVIGGEAIEARGTAYLQDVLRGVHGGVVTQGHTFGLQT